MHEDLEAFADVFEAFLRGHVYIRDDKAYKVLTVWVICSYFMDSWNNFPHIYIGSPMHGSGKSTLAKAMLCGTANPKKEKKLTFPSLVSIIREAKIKGNVLNTYTLGGQLLFNFYPDMKITIDSRVDAYGESYMSFYQNLLYGSYEFLEQFLDRYSVNHMIIDYRALRGLSQNNKLNRLKQEGWKVIRQGKKVIILSSL